MTNFLKLHKEILENSMLSNRAKILFAMLCSRRSLSLSHGYVDSNGEPYVFCSPESAAVSLNCSRKTAIGALKNLADCQLINKCGKNRYYIKNISGSFVMIPQSALALGNDCAVLYAFIASRILNSLKTFCAYKNTEIQAVLSCGNKKACELLSKLEGEQLIEVRRTHEGNVLSLTGKMAKMTLRIISEKIEKIKAKKSENATSSLPTRDVNNEKSKCENCQNHSVIFATKIDKAKLNNISYISSMDEARDKIAQKLSLKNYDTYATPYIEAIMSIVEKAVSTKGKSMWIAGKLRPKMDVIEKIASLSMADIDEICMNISKRKGIINLQSYVFACVMNATPSAENDNQHSYDLSKLRSVFEIDAPSPNAVPSADYVRRHSYDLNKLKSVISSAPKHSYDLEAFERLAIGATF